MQIHKINHTRLQQELLRYLYLQSGPFTANALAKRLEVSTTAIIKAINGLDLVKVTKDKESKRLSITVDRDNPRLTERKRIENLKMLYESNLPETLAEQFPGATIILFGSFAYGEDTEKSDIDIAIIGAKEKEIDVSPYSLRFHRPISVHFFGKFEDIDKNLKENLCNGIVLAGGIQL